MVQGGRHLTQLQGGSPEETEIFSKVEKAFYRQK